MTDSIDEPNGETVVVNIEADPEPVIEEVSDDGDNVVIVEGDDAVEAVIVEETIDQAERIALLEAELATLRGEVFEAQMTADDAVFIAEANAEETEQADEAIIEAVDETVEDLEEQVNDELSEGDSLLSGSDDDEPAIDVAPASARIHPLFRSFKDWKN